MTYLKFCFIVIYILHLAYTIHVSDYKSYKDYKLYEVSGEKTGLEKLIEYVTKNYDIPFHEQVKFEEQFKAHILVPPNVAKSLVDIADIAQLSCALIIDDYSEIILSERVSPRGNQFSWTAYYDVDDFGREAKSLSPPSLPSANGTPAPFSRLCTSHLTAYLASLVNPAVEALPIYNYLRNTSKDYPDSTEVIVGGETYEGRQILGLRINTPEGGPDKPVMFIESGIHAREWITPATTTYFINQLLTSDNNAIIAIRNQFDWRIFPTVNPDGYHYTFKRDRMWRKTRSRSTWRCYGADPNRNWNYNWGNYSSSSDPCDYQIYAGSQPFSEKETRSLSQYISSIENLLGYVAFHSYAQTLLLPYSDSTDHVDNYDDLVKIGQISLEYGRAVNGEKYDGPGTAAEILYKASGGSMDWVRHSLGTPLVYTYELRGVYFHWPASRIPEQGEEVTQMILGLVAGAKDLGYF